MRYILALSFIFTSFNGYCASAAAGAGKADAEAPRATFTAGTFIPDARHTVVNTLMAKKMKSTMHPTRTGLGRSAIYSHVLPDFMSKAGEGGTVLDLGCGRAGHIMPLFNGRKAPLYYTAVDLNTAEASENFGAHMPAKTLMEDGSTLNFISNEVVTYLKTVPADSVDSAFAGHLIHFLDPFQLIDFYREVRRVLKPGHTLYLTWGDYHAGKNPALMTEYEGKLDTPWPGINVNGGLRRHMISKYLIENFPSKDLESEVLNVVTRKLRSMGRGENPKTITDVFVKAFISDATPLANILKPMEMKPLVEELGFKTTAGFPEHYMDIDSDGMANTYYGFILEKSEIAIDEAAIATRLAAAKAVIDSVRKVALPKKLNKDDVLKNYVIETLNAILTPAKK